NCARSPCVFSGSRRSSPSGANRKPSPCSTQSNVIMAAKITCPHCDAVLKPAKPLAAGKKVNCPRCGEVFTVRDEEEEEEPRPARAVPARPAKKAVPAKPARPAKPAAPAPPPKKSAADDDDDGELTYGVIREPEDEEEDKPKVDYVPDLTVK